MNAIIALLFFAVIGVVCGNVVKQNVDGSSSSSSSSSSSDMEVARKHNNDGSSHHSLNLRTADYIRAVDVFKAKVAYRLDTSNILSTQPDMKTRLLNIAVDKFKSCEKLNRESHSCLGTATGQVMSLIAAYEKNQANQLSELINQS